MNSGANAHMTFDGDGISDDEANSWEDDLSESDDYYDEEDEVEEASPLPKPEGIENE